MSIGPGTTVHSLLTVGAGLLRAGQTRGSSAKGTATHVDAFFFCSSFPEIELCSLPLQRPLNHAGGMFDGHGEREGGGGSTSRMAWTAYGMGGLTWDGAWRAGERVLWALRCMGPATTCLLFLLPSVNRGRDRVVAPRSLGCLLACRGVVELWCVDRQRENVSVREEEDEEKQEE